MTDRTSTANYQPPKGKPTLDPALTYTSPEAAAYLGLDPQTLAKWRCKGKGPNYLKIGRGVSYRGADLLAFEQSCIVVVKKAA